MILGYSYRWIGGTQLDMQRVWLPAVGAAAAGPIREQLLGGAGDGFISWCKDNAVVGVGGGYATFGSDFGWTTPAAAARRPARL